MSHSTEAPGGIVRSETAMTGSVSIGSVSRVRLQTTLATMVGTWFGCGFLPIAPGTGAAAAAVLLAWGMQYWLGWGRWEFLLLALAACVPGVWASSVLAGERGVRDPDLVVVDEVIGQWVTLAGVSTLSWVTVPLAFVLFRIFDIWKPAPVRQLERLPRGFGIVADDMMAGVYGALILYLIGS